MLRIVLLLVIFCSSALAQVSEYPNDQEIPQGNQATQQAPENTDEESTSEPSLLRSGSGSQRASINTGPDSGINTDDAQYNSSGESEFEIAKSDLKAQWTMAIMAILITLVAAGSLAVSVWATILIKATLKSNKYLLRHSRKAVAAANRSAKEAAAANKITGKSVRAAREMNQIAREAMAKELRAYITIDSLTYDHYVGRSGTVIVSMKNTGQTPAHDVILKWEPLVLPEEIDDDFQPQSLMKNPQTRHLGVVGGGTEIEEKIPWSINSHIKVGEELFLCGQISYKDSFKEWQHTCFFWLLAPTLGTTMRCHVGNYGT